MKRYLNVSNATELVDFAKDVARKRLEDITDTNNLVNVFIRGRKVAKVPTGSTDTADSRVGDFNCTPTFLYVCVDNAGTAEWRRVAIGSW